ncbi:MAG: hypothetical protein LBV32_03720, partial [Tannerellaceae bacterium]|nr:hypothetical protein [Tannerellaceae bacterium]
MAKSYFEVLNEIFFNPQSERSEWPQACLLPSGFNRRLIISGFKAGSSVGFNPLIFSPLYLW